WTWMGDIYLANENWNPDYFFGISHNTPELEDRFTDFQNLQTCNEFEDRVKEFMKDFVKDQKSLKRARETFPTNRDNSQWKIQKNRYLGYLALATNPSAKIVYLEG